MFNRHHYLLFDVVHGVGEKDGGGWIRGTHLGLWTLQCWEEGGVKEGWLVETKARSYVTSHTEVGVLGEEKEKIINTTLRLVTWMSEPNSSI